MTIASALSLEVSAQQWKSSAPVDGGRYYLYNVGKGGFLKNDDIRARVSLSAPTVTVTLQAADDGRFYIKAGEFRPDKENPYLVENTDNKNVYTDINWGSYTITPWKFVLKEGTSNVYYIKTTQNRNLEVDSRDKGSRVNPLTRTTGSSTSAGAPGWDEWMLVTPEDYAAATRTDYTSRVAHDKSSWHATGMWGSTDFVEHYLDPTPAGNVLYQTITGLPTGIYEVRMYAWAHNESGRNATLKGRTRDVAYIYAESDNRVERDILSCGGDISPGHDIRGDENTWPYTIHDVVVKNGVLTIGMTIRDGKGGLTNWQAAQIYSLTRTGDLPLDDQIAAYEAALARATTTSVDAGLPAGFRGVLQAVINANSGANAPSYTNAEALNAATLALNNGVTAAESSRAPYSHYLALRALALSADDDTSVFTPATASVDVSQADDHVASATSLVGIADATEQLRTAVKSFISSVTVTGRIDISALITNAGFEDNTTDGWTAEGSGTWRPMEWDGGYGAEFWHGTRDIHQTITGLPDGRYELAVQATWRDTQTTGLYLTAGTTSSARIEEKAASYDVDDVKGGLARMNSDPAYARFTVSNTLTGDAITIGLKEKMFGSGECWTLFDNFQLYYYGADYTDAEARLGEAFDRAAAAAEQEIPTAAKEELNNLRTTYTAASLELSSRTFVDNIAAFDAAIADINDKINNANGLVAPYAHYKYFQHTDDPILAQTAVYSDEGGTQTTALTTALATIASNVEAATTEAAIETQIRALYAAYATFVHETNIAGKYFDLTSLIYNPRFLLEKRTGWTKTGSATGNGKVTSGELTGHEYWNGSYDFYQVLPTLPAGTYKLNVNAFHRISGDKADARNADPNNIPALVRMNYATVRMRSIQEGTAEDVPTGLAALAEGQYENELAYMADATMTDAQIGLRLDRQLADNSWSLFTNFRLYYTTEDASVFLTPYNEALAAAQAVDAQAKMNAEEKAELLAAIAADATLNKSNMATVQDATLRLTNATSTALTSIAAYAAAKIAIDRINAEMESTNVVTPEAIATFSGYGTAYVGGLLTDDDASAMERRVFRDQDNTNANMIDEYLLSAWKEGDTQMRDKEGALVINTWSTETDVPGFVTPFYEVDDGYHATTVAHTLKATMGGLEAGHYKVELWARTRMKTNDVTNDDLPENITFQLNDGAPVKLEGKLYTNHFRADNYTVYGAVGTDGQLVLTLNIPASSTHGMWLSFKNVKYTKIDVSDVAITETTDYTPAAGIANVTLTRTFNANAWNTLVLPFEVRNVEGVFGEGVKVARYTGATGENDLYTLHFAESDFIPANEPVFVYGVSNTAPYTFPYVTIEEGTAEKADANINFVGSYKASTTLAAGNFFIASDNNLYKVGEASMVNLKGTRAYFQPVSGTQVKALNVAFDDETTAVTTPLATGRGVGREAWYDLSGRRIVNRKLPRGVYIQNGKKVVSY